MLNQQGPNSVKFGIPPIEQFTINKPKERKFINFTKLNEILFGGHTYYSNEGRAEQINSSLPDPEYVKRIDELWELMGIPRDRFGEPNLCDTNERVAQRFIRYISGLRVPLIKNNYEIHKIQKKLENTQKLIMGDDNICPTTKLVCDDECCTPGSQCNLDGSGIEPFSGLESGCPIMPK